MLSEELRDILAIEPDAEVQPSSCSIISNSLSSKALKMVENRLPGILDVESLASKESDSETDSSGDGEE